MKLKKLFAGIVAVAMMATMAAPVFADDAPASSSKVQKNLNGGQVAIEKVITGTGYTSETVSLNVGNGKAVAVYHSSLDTEGAPTISIPTTETNGVAISETDGGKGTLHIKLQEYKHVGTYVYEFAEKAGSTAGMTYDTKTKWLVVHAYNDTDTDGTIKDGALKVNAVVLDTDPQSVLSNKENKGDLTSLTNNKIDQITNKYEAGKYTVKKLVKGNMSDREKVFHFRVTFVKAKDATIPGIKYDGNALVLDNWTAVEGNPNKVFTTTDIDLTHNNPKSFENIPYGVTVSVVELDDNKKVLENNTNGEYTVSYEKNTATEIDANNNDVKATITNTSTVNVDTGVILDNAPYIALLTIVAAGAVVMIMKKRRNYED